MLQACSSLTTAVEKGEGLSPAQTAALLTKVVDSCTLAMQADHECNMARRQAIKPNIKQTFQQLCSRDIPVGAHLFGDNLTEQVSKIKDQTAVKVAVTKPPFRPTTRFSPYTTSKGDSPSWKKNLRRLPFLGRRQPKQQPPDPTYQYHSSKQYRTTNHHAPQTYFSHKRGGGGGKRK